MHDHHDQLRDSLVIEDPAAVIAGLEDMWRIQPPCYYTGAQLPPLHKTIYDQRPAGENPYWDIVRLMPLDSLFSGGLWGREVAVDGYKCHVDGRHVVVRNQLTLTYAWAIPTPADIAWIASLVRGRGIVEIGAGTGYWAWQLSQALVHVVAFDRKPGGNWYCGTTQYHPVHHGGPEQAAKFPNRALMLCWPPFEDPMAADALRAYAGDTLIFIGEHGGCTGDEEFFKLLAADWVHIGDSPRHVTFTGVHCHVEAYRRQEADHG